MERRMAMVHHKMFRIPIPVLNRAVLGGHAAAAGLARTLRTIEDEALATLNSSTALFHPEGDSVANIFDVYLFIAVAEPERIVWSVEK
jgi:hypothetical protein